MIGLTQEEADFVRAGKRIKAVYSVRRRTNLGLVSSNAYVHSWDGSTICKEEPEKPVGPPLPRGVVGGVLSANPWAWEGCGHYYAPEGPEDCPTCLRAKIATLTDALHIAYDWMGREAVDTYGRARESEDRQQVRDILDGAPKLRCACPGVKLREGETAKCSVCKLEEEKNS